MMRPLYWEELYDDKQTEAEKEGMIDKRMSLGLDRIREKDS